jgi:predicted DNA-binding transcriptional regulator YafY
MTATERRYSILKILCRDRYAKYRDLANEFRVTIRTISRDIEILSLTEPLYNKQGRYEGGVYVMDGYHINFNYFNEVQVQLIEKYIVMAVNHQLCILDEREMRSLKNMLAMYSKPNRKNEGGK